MRRLLFSALLVCAPILHAANFTNGQAARAEIGQYFFNASQGSPSTVVLGGPQGIAYWNGNLYVADGNVLGAGWPDSNNVLQTGNRVLQFPVSDIPGPYADLTKTSVNNSLCALCGLPATNILGTNNYTFYAPGVGNQSGTGSSASGSVGFNQPTAVATDGTTLAVADTGNNRVLLWFAPSGGTVANIALDAPANVVLGQPDFKTVQTATTAVYPTSLSGPQGVWIQNGKLFVTDSGHNRVLVWNRIPTQINQAPDFALGQPNTYTAPAINPSTYVATASNMWGPTGVSSDGVHLFVADTGFSRVLIWNSIPSSSGQAADLVVGQANTASGAPDNSTVLCASNGTDSSGNPTYPAMCQSTLNYPRFALSDGQRLFIADGGNDRVLVYNSIPTQNGVAADTVLGQPDFQTDVLSTPDTSITSTTVDNTGATNTIATPTSLAFDGTNLYVVDVFNRRVLLFSEGDIALAGNAVLNAASEETHQAGYVTLAGSIVANDTVTITIQGTNYTYTIQSTDTLQSVTASLIKQINNSNSNAGDPNVLALGGAQTDTLYISSKGVNLGLDAISLGATTSNTADITATPSGSYLTGGNGSTVAPGTIVEIDYSPSGPNAPGLADTTISANANSSIPISQSNPLPTTLGNAQVFIDGIAAPLFMVSPTQIKAQVPFEFSNRNSSSLYVRTVHANGSETVSVAAPVIIAPANPGLFRNTTSQVNPPPAYQPQHQSGNPSVSVTVAVTTIQAGDQAAIAINGRNYSYTVTSSDTLASITSALTSAVNNGNDPQVTASNTGNTGTILFTAKVSGSQGTGISVSTSTTPASGQTSAGITLTGGGSTCCSDSGTGAITANNPAQPGEIVTLYATGLGLVQDASNNPIGAITGAPYDGPTVNSATNYAIATVGGTDEAIVSSGLAPGGVGVYAVQIPVPAGISSNGALPFYIAQNAYISNTVTLPVGTPPGALSTILATPNPIPVSSGQTLGQTTISWNTSVSTNVQVRVGSPGGALFATGNGQGSATTGTWVSDGTVFYLQDGTQSNPASTSATLGTVTVHLTTSTSGGGGGTGGGGGGTPTNPGQPVFGKFCPATVWTQNSNVTFSFQPGTILVPIGTTTGQTTVTWTDGPTVTSSNLYIAGPNGGQPALLGSGGTYGLATTGDWVTDGLLFFLQNDTNGNDQQTSNTLACGIVHVQQSSTVSSLGTITASPQTIQAAQNADGSFQPVQTTLNWSCPTCDSVEVRVGGVNGSLFARSSFNTEGASGSATTGMWVTNGTTFYLVNTTGGANSEIASVSITLVPISSSGSSGNGKTGVITGTPDPALYTNGGAALAQITVTWSCQSCTNTEVHVGSPGGALFATGLSSGASTTGNWVTNGTVFYLQDSSSGNGSSPSNTVATFTAVVQEAPPGPPSYSNGNATISASPNPILLSGNFGETVLTWSCSTCTSTEVHVGSPDGVLFATGTSVGTATTGNWVTNGTIFYLQDSSNGNSTSASNTVAWIEVETVPE